MNEECDRQDLCVYSGLPCMQKHEEMWIKQGKSEWKGNLKLVTDELRQKFGEICEKYKIAACPEEEPLHDNAKAEVKKIPILTNSKPDYDERDAFGVPVSVVF